ncbi:MAG: hypothetical protein RLZZ292_1353 [Bacteroidota bacterium]|jgi:hypothetical protein
MKTKTIFFVLLFALPFLGKAQYSIGLSSSYNIGNNEYNTMYARQIAVGLSLGKQVSNHVELQFKIEPVFSKEGAIFPRRCGNDATPITTLPLPTYEKTPSILQSSFLIRLRPIANGKRVRLTLGSGMAYRGIKSSRLARNNKVGDVVVIARDLNTFIGLPMVVGLEMDIKSCSISLEQSNMCFLDLNNLADYKNNSYFYYGASLNLVYHLFAKK